MKYDLQDIATVSGMPGLFKVLKPTRTGVVLESLDSVKKRIMAQTRHKISILKEISIFTTGVEDNIVLEDVFQSIYAKFKEKLDIDHKSASIDELKVFLGGVVSDFDEDRVYPSDIKKLIQWYKIVSKEMKPVKIEEEKKKEEKGTKSKTTAEKTDSKKEAKPAAKKKSTAKKPPVAAKKAKAAPVKKAAVNKKNG